MTQYAKRCNNYLVICIVALMINCGGGGGKDEAGVDATRSAVWEKTFTHIKGIVAKDVIQTNDGDYMVIGGVTSIGAGGFDIYVMKLNYNGEVMWERTYGDVGDEIGHSIKQTNRGRYVIAGGGKLATGNFETAVVLLLDEGGDVIWERRFDDRRGINGTATSVLQTADGGFAIIGNGRRFGGPSAGGVGMGYVAKLDANGFIVWFQGFIGYETFSQSFALEESDDGKILVAWKIIVLFSYIPNQIFVEQWDSNGGSTGVGYSIQVGRRDDRWHSIKQTLDGGYILTGHMISSYGNDLGGICLIKLSPDLSEEWVKFIGASPVDTGYAVRQTDDGGFIITGETQNDSAATNELYLAKTDAQGEVLWERFYEGLKQAGGRSIACTKDGGYIVVGNTDDNVSGESGIYLIKADKDGNVR